MYVGKLMFQAELFWTTQHLFSKIPVDTAQLFEEFARGDLVVCKRSLGYGMFTKDSQGVRQW